MTIAFPSEEVARATAAPTSVEPLTTDHEPPITDQEPIKRPISEKKLTANRANAKKSTGPRTPQGKKTVSQNATTHGLTATPDPKLFLDPNYDARRYELTKEFRPQSPTQTYLVEQLALIGHKLDQIPHLESHLLAQAAAQATPPDSSFILQPSSLSSLIAHEFLKDRPTPLTRLYDLQRRLQSRFQSIIRQIHQLQKHQSAQRAQDLQQESDADRQKRIDQDHAALKEELDRIHEKNKRNAEEKRLQRHSEENHLLPKPFSGRACPTGLTAPAQNKPTQSPSTPIQNAPAQIKPTAPAPSPQKPTPPPAQIEPIPQSPIGNPQYAFANTPATPTLPHPGGTYP